MSSVYYFLADSRFPKACDLQDYSIGLCSTTIDQTTNVCSMDSSSSYNPWFSISEYCAASEYPKCICQGALACGPFVNRKTAFDAIEDKILAISIVGPIYQRISTNVLIGFSIALCLLILSRFNKNSLMVQQHSAADKEKEYESTIRALSQKVKKQLKIINKLEMSHALTLGGSATPSAAGQSPTVGTKRFLLSP